MHVILCADDRNGMMFHRRRQSRDRAVLEDIEKLRAGKKLLMNKYSDKMFSEYGYSDHETFESSEAALTAAGEDDFCFLEDISPYRYLPMESALPVGSADRRRSARRLGGCRTHGF